MKTSAASGTVVVHVVQRNTRHAELVEYPLAAGGISVGVAGDTGGNVIVGNAGVNKSFGSSLETHLRVVDKAARLNELGEANAENIGVLLAGGHGEVFGDVRRLEREG